MLIKASTTTSAATPSNAPCTILGDLAPAPLVGNSQHRTRMQVVDMLGCALPVCALSYSCIGELVRHRENGLVFDSGDELAEQLTEVFKGFSGSAAAAPGQLAGRSPLLQQLRAGVAGANMDRWHENWARVALPLLLPNSGGS